MTPRAGLSHLTRVATIARNSAWPLLCQVSTSILKGAPNVRPFRNSNMQIRFADTRPQGDYALVVPVAGKDRSSLATLAPAPEAVGAALDRQRFEGEASS